MIVGYVDDGFSYFTPFPALNLKERVIRGAGDTACGQPMHDRGVKLRGFMIFGAKLGLFLSWIWRRVPLVDMATTNQSNVLWDPSGRIQVP